jgi:phospholipase A1
VNWAFPLAQHLRGYVQFFTGYGENMIDMENNNTRIGVGIALTDWL